MRSNSLDMVNRSINPAILGKEMPGETGNALPPATNV